MTRLVVIFLIFFLYLLQTTFAVPHCPNDCSGHGNCVFQHGADVCVCSSGWGGNDCSFPVKTATSGTEYSDTVALFSWQYYHIQVPSGSHQIVVDVTQQNQNGGTSDCDLYLKNGHFPTRSDYDARDLTTKDSFSITQAYSSSEEVYIGVFGFTRCDYRITITLQGGCPINDGKECSGHGDCVDTTCDCEAGWSGDDCSESDDEIQFGTSVSGSVGNREWKYYHIRVAEKINQLNVYVIQQEDPPANDIDVYLQREKAPTITDFETCNAGLQKNITVLKVDPQEGYWYIGIYAYKGEMTHFTLFVQSDQECENGCSGRTHGTCTQSNPPTCSCLSGFEGDFCETKTAVMRNGDSERGYVESFTWNYYTYEVSTASNFVVEVTQDDAAADCDVFLKEGSKPSLVSFDAKDQGLKKEFNVTVERPTSGTWWIGVMGINIRTPCSYTITTLETSSCSIQCVHGTCNSEGRCDCDAGWSGEDCSTQMVEINSGDKKTGSVDENEWAYYHISTSASTVYVDLHEKSDVGEIWLYTNEHDVPDLRNYERADTSKSGRHRINLAYERSQPRDITIGVYGGPFMEHGPKDYEITVWATDF